MGRLTLLTPSARMLAFTKHRSKRFVHQYQPDCNDNFIPLGPELKKKSTSTRKNHQQLL